MRHSLRCDRRICLLPLMAAWILLGARVVLADWPRFRGPTGDGVCRDSDVPVQWSDRRHLKWKLKLPGRGFSSPIIVGQYIFVTCYSEADGDLTGLKRHLLCVSRDHGNIVWEKTVPSSGREVRGPSFGTSHGYASHTPASDGKHVFVLFGSTGVLAFDMQGNKLWQASVGASNASLFGSAASPILDGDRLIVTAAAESTSIRALDKKTGKQLWRFDDSRLSRCYATPLVARNPAGKDELLISVPFQLWSLDPKTGKRNWYAATKVDRNAVPCPVAQAGICYIIGGRSGGRAAVRLGGQDDVTEDHVLWSMAGGSYVSSPVLYRGHLYWFTHRGFAVCADAKTGEEVSRKRLGGSFYASPVLIKDKLYAVSRFDGTYVLEATPKLTQVAHNQLADQSDFSASPAVSDNQMILRSDHYLYCIE